MAERTYQRIHCKIDDFPEEAREAIDRMLADPTTTYTEIAETMEDKRRLVARMQDTFLSQLREQVRGDEELTRKLAELVAKAGQEALDAES